MKILLIFLFYSSLAFSASVTHHTNESGEINSINLPITINIIKATCSINNDLGIPSVVNLGNSNIHQDKFVSFPISFSNCNNVNEIDYEFSQISNYLFIGNGMFHTSNSDILLTLYNGDSILYNYKGNIKMNSNNVTIPFKIKVTGNKAGAYHSAINLSLIYI